LFVSTGSQAQITVEDVLREIAGLDEIQAVAAYVEDFDVERFQRAATVLRECGKRLIVLKGGLSEVGGKATAAHSRSLASNGRTFRQMAMSTGAVLVRDPDELLAALTLSESGGRRVHVATISGGLSVIAADLADDLGLELPAPSAETVAAMQRVRMPGVNPLDLEAGANTFREQAGAIAALAHDQEADIALVVINDMPGLEELLAELRPVVDGAGNRIVLCSACSKQEDELWKEWVDGGRQFIEGLDSTLRALAALHPDRMEPKHITDEAPGQMSPERVHALLADAGIPSLAGREVETEEEALQAAEAMGYPVVLKVARASHRGVEGVRTGLSSRDDVIAAFAEMRGYGTVLVQPEAHAGLEFYVGLTSDPRFGLLLMIGMGGSQLERVRDIAVAPCPVQPETVWQMIGQTAVGSWLGRPASAGVVDLSALVDVACGAATLAASLGPQFQSMDLNPVIVSASGAAVIDGKITIEPSARSGGSTSKEAYP
jgi:acetate---CoA ligase (ADP-forming)